MEPIATAAEAPPRPLPPPVPHPARAPFLLSSALLGGLLVLASGLMLAGEVWPNPMGWLLFLASLGCLLLTLWPRRVDPQDPAGSSFAAFAATVLVTLLLYNATAGAMKASREFEGFARVSFSNHADVVLLRPAGGERSFAFRSAELRRRFADLEGAELRARLRVTRSLGELRGAELLESDGLPMNLRAIGYVDHRPGANERRVRFRRRGLD